MKTLKIVPILLMLVSLQCAYAQKATGRGEQYGRTLNAGLGMVYFGYVGQTVPAVHLNYEFDVAKSFTLAPFITYFGYTEYRYWGGPSYAYRNYSYRETVMPIGLKGTYYFDRILGAGPKWDFYLGASVGFAIRKTIWENGYYGDRAVSRGATPLYLDGHIGTEYHLSRKAGLFLDLSSGISTIGLACHL